MEIVVAACRCCCVTRWIRLDQPSSLHLSFKSVFLPACLRSEAQPHSQKQFNSIRSQLLLAMSSPFPSAAPTQSLRPSAFPTFGPSGLPSPAPSLRPSSLPSLEPTISVEPSALPSLEPTISVAPSVFPSLDPTQSSLPSTVPSSAPSSMPSAAPSQYTVGFDVIGNSGKFKVSTRLTNVTVAVDSLYEVDANGNPVGTSGASKHSIQTFANQEFQFGQSFEAPYDITVGGDGTGPNASILPFTSTVSDDIGTIRVETFIFKEHGTVTTDGSEEETMSVTTGDFKWNIELSDWSFCGVDVECKQGQTEQVGAGIEVKMEMKGNGNAMEINDGRKVELGGGLEVFVSKMLYCDNEWLPMEAGYPLFTVQGSKQLWTLRFPRFISTCTYDPLLNTGAVLAEEAATSSPSLSPSSLPSDPVETERPSKHPSDPPSTIASAPPSFRPTPTDDVDDDDDTSGAFELAGHQLFYAPLIAAVLYLAI